MDFVLHGVSFRCHLSFCAEISQCWLDGLSSPDESDYEYQKSLGNNR